MTIEKFSTILYKECYDRIGHIGNIEFSIDSAPFENSKKKYCAYSYTYTAQLRQAG